MGRVPTRRRVLRIRDAVVDEHAATLVVEEPTEIRVRGRALTITTRTPGGQAHVAKVVGRQRASWGTPGRPFLLRMSSRLRGVEPPQIPYWALVRNANSMHTSSTAAIGERFDESA